MKFRAVFTDAYIVMRTDHGNKPFQVSRGDEIIVWPKSKRRHGRLYWAACSTGEEWNKGFYYARAELDESQFEIKERLDG